MGLSKEDRKLLYTKMYTAVSKATAETKNAKGEAIKVTYNGRVADLFGGICSNAPTIRAFMWAITHKTDALPTSLFRVVDHGKNGCEVSRIHSGFYDDQRNHITGTALIPFIMDAMKLWEPTPRAKKEVALNEEVQPSPEFNIQDLTDDELTVIQFKIQQELERRAALRERQSKLQQVLELAEMSKEELMEILNIV